MLTNAAAFGGNPFQQVQQSPPLPIVDVGNPARRAAYAELMIRKGRPWRTVFFFPLLFRLLPFFFLFYFGLAGVDQRTRLRMRPRR